MIEFDIVLTSEAQADIRKLAPALRNRILDKLEWMGANAQLLRHQSLRGKEWTGVFKYRVGSYRIIYQLDTQVKKLIVLKVRHRSDVDKL